MEAKEYLAELERLNIIIENKCNEVSEMREALKNPGSPNFQSEKVSGGFLPGTSGPQKKVSDLSAAEKELDIMIDEYNYFRKRMINQIYKLRNKTHVKFLYKRYIEGKALRRIAEEIHKNYEYTRQLNTISLNDFAKVHEKFLKNFTIFSYRLEQFRT